MEKATGPKEGRKQGKTLPVGPSSLLSCRCLPPLEAAQKPAGPPALELQHTGWPPGIQNKQKKAEKAL